MEGPPEAERFIHEPVPGAPGWLTWNMADRTRYNAFLGDIHVRPAEDGIARVRMFPEHQHSNLGNGVHGGTILGFIDIALFAGSRMLGIDFGSFGTTVDLNTQFVDRGIIGVPLDALVESPRSGRNLTFLRGTLVQPWGEGERIVATFSGLIRASR